VFVGHSLGGLVARVYAGEHPDEVAGIVFVDHAFTLIMHGAPPGQAQATPAPPPMAPAPPMVLGPVVGKAMGLESDPNFGKLPERDRELHLWAIAQARDQAALQSNPETSMPCAWQADAFAKERAHPLGDKPIVDVSTDDSRTPDYVKLQTDLLALSQNSKEIIAENSGHFVIIDRPDVVVDAVRQVVQAVHHNGKL